MPPASPVMFDVELLFIPGRQSPAYLLLNFSAIRTLKAFGFPQRPFIGVNLFKAKTFYSQTLRSPLRTRTQLESFRACQAKVPRHRHQQSHPP